MKAEIITLGVGHGDSILIRWEGEDIHQQWNCLIDGGISKQKLKDYLVEYEIKTLDLVIGTHPDSDHINGLLGAEDFINSGSTYWAPPLPAFQRHQWLYGSRCKGAMDRCEQVEKIFNQKGATILYPVEGFSSAPFLNAGPRMHVLSPAAKLIDYLFTKDDVDFLFTSDVMPLGWITQLPDDTNPDQAGDITAMKNALLAGVLSPSDISDNLRTPIDARSDIEKHIEDWSKRTGEDPEFFGDSAFNNSSIVCWLELPIGNKNYRILLPGDQENWTYLLARNPRGLQADVFKAPHHGGRLYLEQDSAHDEVLSQVRPKIVLMSANGQHKLPRSAIRESAIQWGAAVMCTSEYAKETLLGSYTEMDCCHDSKGCLKDPSNSIALSFDEKGIHSNRRSCHPGYGLAHGPIINIKQHIIDPSNVVDRLGTQELRKHINWVKTKLNDIHEKRSGQAKRLVPGSKVVSPKDLIALAKDEERPIFTANISTILSKGRDRGVFWATPKKQSHHDPNAVYKKPGRNDLKKFSGLLEDKVMILFPEAYDPVNDDPDTLLTSLDPNGLAAFADAYLHYPQDIFETMFWPSIIKLFKQKDWHCYTSKSDLAFTTIQDPSLFQLNVTRTFLKPGGLYESRKRYSANILFTQPILVSGMANYSSSNNYYDIEKTVGVIQDNWLFKPRMFSKESLTWLLDLASDLKIDFGCTIHWDGSQYEFTTSDWEDSGIKEDDWPDELIKIISQGEPLTYSMEIRQLLYILKQKPDMLEKLSIQNQEIKRLW